MEMIFLSSGDELGSKYSFHCDFCAKFADIVLTLLKKIETSFENNDCDKVMECTSFQL